MKLGHNADAVADLRRAAELEPTVAPRAASEDVFDPIRAEADALQQ